MTESERASMLLGDALRRAMLDTSRAPSNRYDARRAKAWAAYSSLCKHYLTEAEARDVRRATGLLDISENWGADARRDEYPDPATAAMIEVRSALHYLPLEVYRPAIEALGKLHDAARLA